MLPLTTACKAPFAAAVVAAATTAAVGSASEMVKAEIQSTIISIFLLSIPSILIAKWCVVNLSFLYLFNLEA